MADIDPQAGRLRYSGGRGETTGRGHLRPDHFNDVDGPTGRSCLDQFEEMNRACRPLVRKQAEVERIAAGPVWMLNEVRAPDFDTTQAT